MSNLLQRVLFALVAAPVFLFLAWHGFETRLLLVMILVAGGSWEFARMVRLKWGGPNLDLFAPVSVAVFLLLYAGPFAFEHHWSALVFVALVLIAFARVETEEIFPWLARQGVGIWFFGVWVAPALWFLFDNRPGWAGAGAFLFITLSMWVADSFAYFAGRAFGKHKLCPGISPKKTVEGAVGGIVATALFSWIVAPYWLPEVAGNLKAPLFGVLLAITSIIGDLLESTIKRATGTKDSSRLFPGHGGIYDRFDSLFFAAPLAVLLLQFLLWVREFPFL